MIERRQSGAGAARRGGVPARAARAAAAVLAGALAAAFFAGSAAAQGWKPARHVELVSASGAGSASDTVLRTVERLLQEKKLIEATTSIINKPGAGGTVGWSYLAQQPGDGHHLTLVIGNLMSNHLTGISTLNPNDLSCVAQLFSEASAVAVRADSPVKDARDLLARLKADPAALSVYAGTTLGGSGHIALALAVRSVGADPRKLRTVVFPAVAQGYAALYGGHIDLVANPHSSFIGPLREGRVRVLAVSSPRRLAGELAQVPTWRELGVDSTVEAFRAIAGPRTMGAAQVAYWEAALRRMSELPDWKQLLEKNAWIDRFATADECRAGFKVQYEQMRTGLTALGLAKQ